MLEPLSILFNSASVVAANRNSAHTWWTGMVGSVLLGLVFAQARLYADVTLMVFFVVTGLIGWWRWRFGGVARTPLPVTHANGWDAIATVVFVGATVGLYGGALHLFTAAVAPYVDSAILASSIAATWLLMQRKVESWWIWIVADLMAVPLYVSKGLPLTGLLYAGYLLNAVWGLRRWRTLARQERGEAAA